MNATAATDGRGTSRLAGSRTDPLQPVRGAVGDESSRGRGRHTGAAPASQLTSSRPAGLSVAAQRQREQLPAFAPLLEELEIAGCSLQRRSLSGNFHDWLLRDDGRVAVMVGQVVGRAAADPVEGALVAQAAWAALRAQAQLAPDASTVLALGSRALWSTPALEQQTHAAVAIVDAIGGHASLAVAGDCLAWRVRAATCEQLACHQPPLGEAASGTYRDYEFELTLRERLLLVADNRQRRASKLTSAVEASLTRLDAERHRRMTAAEALAIVRGRYERAVENDPRMSASIVAVRRR